MRDKYFFRSEGGELEPAFSLKEEELFFETLPGESPGESLKQGTEEELPQGQPIPPPKRFEKLVFERLLSLEEFYNPKLLLDRLKREGKL